MAEKNEVRRKFGKYFLANSLLSALLLKGKTVKAGKLPQPKGKIKTKKLQNSIYTSYYSLDCQELLPSKFLLAKGAFYSFTKPIPCLLLGKVHALTN